MSSHFTYSDDVALLKEADALAPWSQNRQMEAWEQIAAALALLPTFPRGKDGRSVRSRCYTLLQKHADRKTGLMRKCGRTEEFYERERLLELVKGKVMLSESGRKRKRISGDAAGHGDDVDNGVSTTTDAVPEAATDAHRLRTSPSTSSAVESRRLDLMERRIDLMQQQIELQREQFDRQAQLQQQLLHTIADLVQRIGDRP